MSDYQKTLFFNYLAQGSAILTGFLLVPMILKFSGLVAVGLFGFLWSFKSIFEIFIGSFSTSVTKSLVVKEAQFSEMITLSLVVNNSYALFASSIFYWIITNKFLEYRLCIFLFSVYVFLSFSNLSVFEYFNSQLKQSFSAMLRSIYQILFLILSLTSYFFLQEFFYIFLALVVAQACVTVISFVVFRKHIKETFIFKMPSLQQFYQVMIKDGSHICIYGLLLIAILQIDILLIEYFYGLEMAGVYTLIVKIPMTIIMLGWRLSEPFGLVVAKGLREQRHFQLYKDFEHLEKKIIFVSFVGALLYFVFGDIIMALWLGGLDKIPSIKGMFLISSVLIFGSIIERLYVSTLFYSSYIWLLNLANIIILLSKTALIVCAYQYFSVLAPLLGWGIVAIGWLPLYRLHVKKLLYSSKA